MSSKDLLNKLHKDINRAFKKVIDDEISTVPKHLVFHANPNCCPLCDTLDGNEYPEDSILEEVSHPHCFCSLDLESPISYEVDDGDADIEMDDVEAEMGTYAHAPEPVLRPLIEKIKHDFVPSMIKELRK